MNVSIFGLGYVGCVSAACLAQDGHTVYGVDVNATKVAQLMAGQSPIVENGLDRLIADQVSAGRLCATLDHYPAIRHSSMTLICVGTPSRNNGSLETRYVEQVCCEIGNALAEKQTYHTVVIRSTVLPGTVRERLIPLLESYSGKQAGRDFGVVMNPEFLREGVALRDYYDPGQIVIGQVDERSGDAVEALYANVDAPVVRTDLESAEMIKYACNAFHALKVSFANEIGNIASTHGVDGRHVMDIVCNDTRLNISPAYLKPGFAFGGSCLPKDVRALTRHARDIDEPTPLLSSILRSNQMQIQRGICMVERTGKQRVGVLGLSFKADTDDLRESPVIPLVETLLGRGYDVTIYDETVNPERLIGTNKQFVYEKLPHIARMLQATLDDVLANSDVLVVTNRSNTYLNIHDRIRPDQTLIDFVGVNGRSDANYHGICW